MSPETLKALREGLAGIAALAIELCDVLDPDPDLEPNGDDEPALGWPAGHGLSQLDPSVRHDDDREQDDSDREPWLGGAATYGEHDLEAGDGGTTWEDAEPSLGWTAQTNQDSPHWAGDGAWLQDGEIDILDLPEGDDEREPNGDEGDFDGGENDPPGHIWGGLGA
ncbi:hypothetical protein [Neoaquamicrobium sediminum]|uniref:hypothetical protein n=1 Tax=Neoaquamicrobium sediminum TaxID=1849104 RepID=UPI003606B45D